MKLKTVIKHNWREILLISALFLSMGSFILAGVSLYMGMVREQRLEDTVRALRLYDIRPELVITWLDYTQSTISIPLIGDPDPDYNEDDTLNQWKYTFINDQIGLNASFRFVIIKIEVPKKAYNHFSLIKCVWVVEENTGALVKTDFTPSESSTYYYQATTDISRHMWKDNVPSRIDLDIILQL